MKRPTVVAALVALALAAACSDSSSSANDDWAVEADELVSLLVDAYDIADPYQTARFFTAGGSSISQYGEKA